MLSIQATATDRMAQRGTSSSSAARKGDDRLAAADAAEAVDAALDLSASGGRGSAGRYADLDPGARTSFLDMLSTLLSRGVVGTETVEVNGEAYVSYLPTRLGDTELERARPWQQEAAPGVLDVHA